MSNKIEVPEHPHDSRAAGGRLHPACSPLLREFVALQNPEAVRWVDASVYHTADWYPLVRRADAILCSVHCEALGQTLDVGGIILRERSMDAFATVSAARAVFDAEDADNTTNPI